LTYLKGVRHRCIGTQARHRMPMAQWKSTRESPKTKAELREMLAEAVRNTQPEPLDPQPPQAKKE
jgi:hypothetical protein